MVITSTRSSSGRRARQALAATAAAAAAVSGLALAAPAYAQGDGTAVQTSIVSANPADFTPNVKDGQVESVVQVGNQIVIGGTFTGLVKGTTTFARTGLAAFNATTGAVSTTFNPTLDGEVTSLDVAANGTSVYVGGYFNTVNGTTHRKLVELDVATGAVIAAFKPAALDGGANDVRRVGNTLWVGGKFTKSGSVTRPILVTLNATTGALTNFSTVAFAGKHNAGTTAVRELAIAPQGDKLIAIGNFTTADGLPRDQVAMLDISGATAQVSGWSTTFFTASCSSSFDTYMRDVAISPDGTYAVFVTTGAYHGATSPCDTQSRFEITGTSGGVTPTWVNVTGGDTTTAVAIVGSVVYVGGHFRWANNPTRGDRAGQGAVERTGLAALDPATGMPFSWNPTRDRGYGVYDFLATSTGLWIGSDTNNVGGEYRARIAFMPLAGGTQLPADNVGSVPGDVIAVGPGASTDNSATSTQVNGSVVPGSTSPMTTGDSWSNARGAMLIDNTLYTAWSDRLMYASPVNGSTIGARTQINLNVGPFCTSTSTSCAGAFTLDVPNLTGMFYDSARMYYTMSGSSTLYYRYFEPESGIVGATRFQATGSLSDLANARGMFLSGGKVYFANAADAGHLYSVPFTSGTVTTEASIGSSATLVDGTRDWRARGLALRSAPAANQAPTAKIAVSCTFLSCTFDGTGSSDNDGAVTSYSWDFGDGGNATGATPGAHVYASAGSYPVKLTVTDNDGATDTASQSLTVSSQPASTVSFRASATASGGSSPAKVTVPTGVQAGDTLVMFVTLNSATTTAAPAGWTQIAEQTDGSPDMVTRVFVKPAVSGDAGSSVSVTLGGTVKSAVTLLAYAGVNTAGVTAAGAAEPGTSASHTAPNVSVSDAGSWVLSYWADKTSGTTSWAVPGSVAARTTVFGSGSGQVGGASADSDGTVPTGTYAGLTATSSTAGAKATSFAVVLPPA